MNAQGFVGMRRCTTTVVYGIVNALNYIKDENNVLLDILFDHLVFIQSLQAKKKDRGEPEVEFVCNL